MKIKSSAFLKMETCQEGSVNNEGSDSSSQTINSDSVLGLNLLHSNHRDTNNIESVSNTLDQDMPIPHTRSVDLRHDSNAMIELLITQDMVRNADSSSEKCKESAVDDEDSDAANDNSKKNLASFLGCVDDGNGSHQGAYFMVNSLVSVQEEIKKYCRQTHSRFVVQKRTSTYGCEGEKLKADLAKNAHHILWKYRARQPQIFDIEFDGEPFIINGHIIYECHRGSLTQYNYLQKKRKNQSADEPAVDSSHRTKKCGCPSKILVKQITKFPNFKILADTERRRKTQSVNLRKQLLSDASQVDHVVVFIGRLPDIREHKFHDYTEELPSSEPLGHRSREFLNRQVWDNPSMTLPTLKDVMSAHIMEVSPSRVTSLSEASLQNSFARARKLLTFASHEIARLQALANEPSMVGRGAFSFRVLEEDQHVELKDSFAEGEEQRPVSKCKFTCLHQTSNQQRLLKKYGSMVYFTCLKRLSYKLPFCVYGLLVQTNMDFQLVAFFVCSGPEELPQALFQVKSANPCWLPLHASLDYCTEQMAAFVAVFPSLAGESGVFVSAHARQEAWSEWLRSENYQEADARDILRLFEAIAQSRSEDSLNKSAKELEMSVWWKCKALRDWFTSKWLTQATKWVVGYQTDLLLCPMRCKITLEQQISQLEEMLDFHTYKASTLEEIISKLNLDVAPSLYDRYVELNKRSYEDQRLRCLSNPDIPRYLSGKPDHVVELVWKMHAAARSEQTSVQQERPGIFSVNPGPESSDAIVHTVYFGEGAALPSCDCEAWLNSSLPCQHMCAVFDSAPGWGWDMLPAYYVAHPLINLDWTCLWGLLSGRCLTTSLDHNYFTGDSTAQQISCAVEKLVHSVQRLRGVDVFGSRDHLLGLRDDVMEVLGYLDTQISGSFAGKVTKVGSEVDSDQSRLVAGCNRPDSAHTSSAEGGDSADAAKPVERSVTVSAPPPCAGQSLLSSEPAIDLSIPESGGLTLSRVSKRPTPDTLRASLKRLLADQLVENPKGMKMFKTLPNADGTVVSQSH